MGEDSLSPEEMVWKATLGFICLALISLLSLMQNDIYDLVLLTDILSWNRHELVHDVAEQVNVSTRVVLNLGHQSSDCTFVLEECRFN